MRKNEGLTEVFTIRVDAPTKALIRRLKGDGIETGLLLRNAIREALAGLNGYVATDSLHAVHDALEIHSSEEPE